MSHPAPVRPTDPAVKAYHDALKTFAHHHADHEGATETAFSRLLTDTARPHGWTLIPKKGMKVGRKHIYPDGTLQDGNFLPRGYWEAKDTDDDLDTEIVKKRKKGYPLANTIFEDTARAVLYQNGAEVERFLLDDPQRVADLLNRFYEFAEPDIEGFEEAVEEFRERVPELARGLAGKITEAHDKNSTFQQAFEKFFDLCRQSLNPNLRREAVDEMLVQHLLTERLFRKIFHEEEFTKRNVIAAEVEQVIAALVSKSFSRDQFLKGLDRFYKAIENAAETIDDFADKQHFLNTVYERFFQGYSVKVADTHGIVYTPQPIVDFMCASVEEVLRAEFGLTLASPGVNVLDPCTGTGNFVVNLLRRVPKKDLPRVYKGQLFANEVMLLPYYIAALNIEHAYGELAGGYEPFEGLCFVDTLDLTAERQPTLFAEKNAERVERQKFTPITVVIGNPPYNVGQLNENDNNKNREYPEIDKRIKQTYVKGSNAKLHTKLYDAYVRFFRWAVDRLQDRDGIVCLVTNNSFVDQHAFDGMRKHLLSDFTKVYHLDLEGNVRRNPKLSGTAYNVFGIQVGVGITVAVRRRKDRTSTLLYHRVDKNLRRADKLDWLTKAKSVAGVAWETLTPDAQHTWLQPENADEFGAFLPIGSKDAKEAGTANPRTIFRSFSLGVSSNRDAVVYGFDTPELAARVERFCDDYNAEIDRYIRKGEPEDLDEFLKTDRVKWSESLKRALRAKQYLEFDPDRLRRALYRPFVPKHLYYAATIVDRSGHFGEYLPTADAENENRVLVVSDIAWRAAQPSAFCCRFAPDLHLCSTLDGHQCFPFYVYDEDGTNRRENVTDWALKQFRDRYRDKKLTKWDLFHYVYAVLHHPGYRSRFADNLKKSLPRIPFAPDFRAFAAAGKQLAELHLGYEQAEPFDLEFVTTPGEPLSYHVEKMVLSKDRTRLVVNDSLTLAGIPKEAFDYRLGNRSALEWVIDQYRVTEDKRSGIQSDPNRVDDEQYIVRLVGQVVRVSVETVKIVAGLPAEYSS